MSTRITPFVKRMRTQGGTIYTFSSALEDIGLNINERNNVVKMSHYALLNIPSIDAPNNLQQNKFNVLAIPGAYESYLTGGSIKNGGILVAESFQNYALNFETNLLADVSYNPSLQTTISERVFWKWLKETGAIRWTPIDTCIGLYWKEETDTDTSVGYNSVVKAIGQISAGSVRTDTFGTYNEVYVLVPTSFGQTPVYFKQIDDDNYHHGLSITNGYVNILGRENYVQPHPDALNYEAYYDLADSSTIVNGTETMYYDNSIGSYNPGWWWTYESSTYGDFSITNDNNYFIDSSNYIDEGIYNISLKYTGTATIEFQRSKVDCISIEYNLDNLKSIFNDSTITFDSLATTLSEDDSYDFNAILVYYSVYNKSLDTNLATNLLGILFLDTASGNTTAYPLSEITLPSITKYQSNTSGFGTSYSFRLNVKSDYMLDDTAATIVDAATSSQLVLEDFSQVFDSLQKSLSILNQHTGTINFITGQYLDITANQTNIENQINDLVYQNNNLDINIIGTENTIAMFASGDDPLVDSSIYMKNGNVGFFNNSPTWKIQIDASLKTKDIYIENAIRDTSGYILLGYGSPLQIGSSLNDRSFNLYDGDGGPYISIRDGSMYFRNIILDGSIVYSDGTPIGGGDVTTVYVAQELARYLPCASLGVGFAWAGPYLYVDVSIAGGGVSQVYVDGSLYLRDVSILNVYNKSNATEVSLGSLTRTIFDASLVTITTRLNTTDSSLNTLRLRHNATEASLGSLTRTVFDASTVTIWNKFANVDTSLLNLGYRDVSIWVKFGSVDTSLLNLGTKNANQDISINALVTRVLFDASTITIWDKFSYVDTSLVNLGTKNANQDISINALVTRILFDASLVTITTRLNTTDSSLNTLRLRHNVTEVSLGSLTRTVFDASLVTIWNKFANVDISLNSIISGSGVTQAYVDGSLALRDTSLLNLGNRDTSTWVKFGSVDTSLLNLGYKDVSIWVKFGSVDTSLLNLGTKNANQDISINALWTAGAVNVLTPGANRIITNDGTATGLNAQANLSFNGTILDVSGNIRFSTGTNRSIYFVDAATTTPSTLSIFGNSNTNTSPAGAGAAMTFRSGTGSIITVGTGGTGGALTVAGGTGGSAASEEPGVIGGVGGLLTIQGGNGGANTGSGAGAGGAGGELLITAGTGGTSASGTVGIGGLLTLRGGNSGSETGGNVRIYGGTGEVSGNVYIANNESTDIGRVFFPSGLVGTPAISFRADTDTGFYWGSANQIRVATGGLWNFAFDTSVFHADGDIIAYSTTTSDIRLKENIMELENPLDKILQLNGITYNTKRTGKKHIGLIAQDVEKIIPLVVEEYTIPFEEDDKELYKTIRYQELIPYLIESIKILENRIKILENK